MITPLNHFPTHPELIEALKNDVSMHTLVRTVGISLKGPWGIIYKDRGR